MKIEIIDDVTYEKFVNKHELSSLYQSLEWKKMKELENKKCELLGLFKGKKLVGASLIIYTPVLKKFHMAYASRGFLYDYKDIKEFKNALLQYFKSKKVIFFRMDPLIILAKYDQDLKREENEKSMQLIQELKQNGFKHFGFNMAAEATQFRFIHRVKLENNFKKQMETMWKSTKKNIESAEMRGVKARKVSDKNLDEMLYFFNLTAERRGFKGLSKRFYLNLLESFGNNIKMYIIYIDKDSYVNNLNNILSDLDKELEDVKREMSRVNVGKKLKNQVTIIENKIAKYQKELEEAKKLEEKTDIAAILTISKYQEIVAFASGMDNDYRLYNPKYVMYPKMMKDAIAEKKEYVNFLGVKNILDKNDKDAGTYEVKRGFGGETIEYIGEFDLPISKVLYRIYKLLKR